MSSLASFLMRYSGSRLVAGARRPAGGVSVSYSRGPTTRTMITPTVGRGSGPVPPPTRSAMATTAQRCRSARLFVLSLGTRPLLSSYICTGLWICSNSPARSWPRLLSSWSSLKSNPTTHIPRVIPWHLRGGPTPRARIASRTRSRITSRSQVGYTPIMSTLALSNTY